MNMSFTKMKCIETPDVTLITSGTPPPEVSKVKTTQNQPSLIQTFESVENPNPLQSWRMSGPGPYMGCL